MIGTFIASTSNSAVSLTSDEPPLVCGETGLGESAPNCEQLLVERKHVQMQRPSLKRRPQIIQTGQNSKRTQQTIQTVTTH